MLRFEDYVKRYGQKIILEVDSLEWTPGLHLLIGPNGGGKTTLLKSLAGIIPYKGSINLDGVGDLRSHPREQRQKINHVAAEPIFPDFLSGEHLVEFYQRVKGGNADQVARIRQSLSIGDYLDQKVGSYSTGMKKKLALLLAWLGQPEWVLLDEPFTGLDPEAQEGLMQLIEEGLSDGINVVSASHQPVWLTHHLDIAYWRVDEGKVESLDAEQARDWLQLLQNAEL